MVPLDFVRQSELAFEACLRVGRGGERTGGEQNAQNQFRCDRMSGVIEFFIVVLLFLEAMLVCWLVGVRIVPSLY